MSEVHHAIGTEGLEAYQMEEDWRDNCHIPPPPTQHCQHRDRKIPHGSMPEHKDENTTQNYHDRDRNNSHPSIPDMEDIQDITDSRLEMF